MDKISNIISKYAEIYSNFEKLQNDNLLANGDQKTGVIGEYYAKIYIENILKSKAKYANNGAPHDLEYSDNNKLVKVQVKAVSYYSKTRTIAPLNMNDEAFDYLYLISLDKNFKPDAFYINTYDEIKSKIGNHLRTRISGTKMKGKCYKGVITKGSRIYNFEDNLV